MSSWGTLVLGMTRRGSPRSACWPGLRQEQTSQPCLDQLSWDQSGVASLAGARYSQATYTAECLAKKSWMGAFSEKVQGVWQVRSQLSWPSYGHLTELYSKASGLCGCSQACGFCLSQIWAGGSSHGPFPSRMDHVARGDRKAPHRAEPPKPSSYWLFHWGQSLHE